MTIKLKTLVIDILKVLKERKSEREATDLAEELSIDYIVLMSAVNDLIEQDLGGFKEKDIYQISLNEEGLGYLKKGLPERQLLQILLKDNIKEINIEDFSKKAKIDKKIFYIGISNMKKNRWIAKSKATGEDKIFLIAKDFPETELEKFLNKFKQSNKITYSDLSKNDLVQFEILNKRKS